jgi:O-antigen/teichoic acid export membrane protein
LRRVYLDSVQLLSVVQWPALLFVAIMARTIILIWLGSSWLEIVPLVRVLCIANLALFAACLSYPVLVAAGGVRDALVASFIALPPSLVVILGASFLGVQAVAASALVTLPFQAAIALYLIGRRLNVGFGDLARALLKSGITTIVTIAGVSICAALIEFGMMNAVLGLVLACFAAAICWLLGLAVTSHPLLPHLYEAASGLAAHAPRFRPRRSTS